MAVEAATSAVDRFTAATRDLLQRVADLERAAQRPSAIVVCTSGTRPTGTEGLRIYEKDTDSELTYDGTGWIIMAEPEQSYTPTVTQSAAVAKTVNNARYQRRNGRCVGRIDLTTTAAGTATNAIRFSLPVAANIPGGRSFETVIGVGAISDTSAGVQYRGILACYSTIEAAMMPASVDSAAGWHLGAIVMTAALANADTIMATFDYEMTTRYS